MMEYNIVANTHLSIGARPRTAVSTAKVMFWSAVVSSAALLPVVLLSGENLWSATARGWGYCWRRRRFPTSAGEV